MKRREFCKTTLLGTTLLMVPGEGLWLLAESSATSMSDPNHTMPFQLFTVAPDSKPRGLTGGLPVVPDYTFESAPQPQVLVVPANGEQDERMFEWVRKVSKTDDVTMSVCTGAFVLAKAGLLKGQKATTHHEFWDSFARKHPDVELMRGRRFVESGGISTAGGLTSGIDLALRVVERYFGREVARNTAAYLEYESKLWQS